MPTGPLPDCSGLILVGYGLPALSPASHDPSPSSRQMNTADHNSETSASGRCRGGRPELDVRVCRSRLTNDRSETGIRPLRSGSGVS